MSVAHKGADELVGRSACLVELETCCLVHLLEALYEVVAVEVLSLVRASDLEPRMSFIG